jgi:Kef-type K+ transport system membrane component KefB
MNTTEIFLLALIVIFLIPFFIWKFFKTENFAPLVVVQIITGIVLGPGLLGSTFPELYKFLFNPNVIASLNGIAWWGVSLFVFTAGVELKLNRLKNNINDTVTAAGFALGFPLIMGSLAALVLLNWQGWIGPKASDWQFVLGIGMACAVTALPILVLFMEKLGVLKQPLGQRILRYASFDDIAIWAVLAVILMDWNRLEQQGLFLVGYAVAAILLRKLIIRFPQEDKIYISLIWLALVAWGADWCGLHFMVGAFLAGVVIDSEWFEREFLDQFRNYVLLLMMPVFFLSTGLKTSWEIGGAVVLAVAVLMFLAQLSGKLLGIHVASKILNWSKGESMLVGWLLQTKALIEIIFVTVLLDKGIITSQMFTAMLFMAIMSTMATIPVVRPLIKKYPNLVQKN